jgi:flagellin
MALAIATNTAALNAAASASSVNRDMETSMARLSTGKRINSAADDAAGVAISSRLSSEIRGTDQAIRNSLDGQALIDTAEGAHKEIENILQRMREVSVQAANDTNNSQDRQNLQSEMDALVTEIDRISATTTWAGENLMQPGGDGTKFSFQVGSATGKENQISVAITAMGSTALGLAADQSNQPPAMTISATSGGGTFDTKEGKITAGIVEGQNGNTSVTLTLTASGNAVVEADLSSDEGIAAAVTAINAVTAASGITASTQVGGGDDGKLKLAYATPTGGDELDILEVTGNTINDMVFDTDTVNTTKNVQISADGVLSYGNAAGGTITLGQTAAGADITAAIDPDDLTASIGLINAETAKSGVTAAIVDTTGADGTVTAAIKLTYSAAPGGTARTGTLSGLSAIVSDTTDNNLPDATFDKATGVLSPGGNSSGAQTSMTLSLGSTEVAITGLTGNETAPLADATKIADKINEATSAHGFSASVQLDETGAATGNVVVNAPRGVTGDVSVANGDDARGAITTIDAAIKTVNIQRSQLGAVSNRLNHTVNNLTNISSNLSAAKGGIEDADFALETTNLAKNQILQQASTAMLAQANASKQNVLSLLQG